MKKEIKKKEVKDHIGAISKGIDRLDIDFGREDLNLMRNKINEIITKG